MRFVAVEREWIGSNLHGVDEDRGRLVSSCRLVSSTNRFVASRGSIRRGAAQTSRSATMNDTAVFITAPEIETAEGGRKGRPAARMEEDTRSIGSCAHIAGPSGLSRCVAFCLQHGIETTHSGPYSASSTFLSHVRALDPSSRHACRTPRTRLHRMGDGGTSE
jgi:hypothetical protein